ncbi:glycine--tRNA ligase subunit beta [Salinisphaera orenii]|uniref:Glycine--tRNA ligase beta subunit n=1 Tax=Salinisphaera orenii YIM 95161 TaxID=1051139 RepID=A0A423PJG1_9GAMM|nr:glycine--tRNA ligase subunit beta [Salinisphaera halophila]ROO25725.1 glycyl-tRNA synthetase [Salinisphaera halophila YIM 95161]
MTAPLLIEIGVEELPPNAMRRLADAFADGLALALDEAGLERGAVTRHATPRRLAVTIDDVAAETAPAAIEKAGPTVAIAFDDEGAPTAAAEGFARSLGTRVEALVREDSDKGERLVYRSTEPGKPLASLLQPAVDEVLRRLPIPKRMRWGDSEAAFVRPVHWVVALHDDTIVPLTVFEESADRVTRGHRFHHPEPIALARAADYAARLRDPGCVIVDPDHRKARIVEQVEAAAAECGGRALIDDALAEEVSALVEWPVGISGDFDARFMVLPREVLISTLEGHQRYFPVEGPDGALLPAFVTVANIDSADVAQVIAGNERVVRPRLADALFFWEQDRQHGLEAHIDGLARVSFQKELGSLADKSARIGRLMRHLNAAVGAEHDHVERAAALAKTDLLTEMVDEFPDLQGVMGCYYARDAGEPEAVATALAEQYAPAAAGAPIASTRVGQLLALADRLDTLAGIFAIGKRPSGDKDPFGLRRAALGVLRTLIEAELPIDLASAIDTAVAMQPVEGAEDTAAALWMFHMERLRGYYGDRGISGDRFDAVAALDLVDMTDFEARIRAVTAFAELPAAAVVCAAHKRIRNILRKNAVAADGTGFEPARLTEPAERALAESMAARQNAIAEAVQTRRYEPALEQVAMLAEPLDAFFDQVMVMVDDPALRDNRLALLKALDGLCRQVVDVSRLALD